MYIYTSNKNLKTEKHVGMKVKNNGNKFILICKTIPTCQSTIVPRIKFCCGNRNIFINVNDRFIYISVSAGEWCENQHSGINC